MRCGLTRPAACACLRGTYELGPLERGLLELGPAELVREDPFGLARRVDVTRGSTALTVLAPPLELPEPVLGSDGDVAFARHGLRSGGHELHGVREHQPGESLRGVHWPATAHRGRLMVKELDDPAGDELAVVLDARASAQVGGPPDSSFEPRWPPPMRWCGRRTRMPGAYGWSSREARASRFARSSAQRCGDCSRVPGRRVSVLPAS